MSVEYQQPAITDLTGALSPELHLRSADLESIVDDLMAYHARFAPLFARQEQREWAAVYLRGLLVADVPRKNVEAMALRLLGAGPGAERRVRALKHFVGEGAWEDDAIVAEHQRYVDETLGEADGVLIIDGSDVPKQGTHAAGVARQWCGATGKKDNCQAGVFLGYASRKVDGPPDVPALKYDLSNAPADTPLDTLVWVSGMRWPIESCFAEGKEEVGLDHDELRFWPGWHHHMTLVLLAHHFLVRLQQRLDQREGGRRPERSAPGLAAADHGPSGAGVTPGAPGLGIPAPARAGVAPERRRGAPAAARTAAAAASRPPRGGSAAALLPPPQARRVLVPPQAALAAP